MADRAEHVGGAHHPTRSDKIQVRDFMLGAAFGGIVAVVATGELILLAAIPGVVASLGVMAIAVKMMQSGSEE